ncbi:RsbR, positive regulator of sigma-B [Bacillus sp. OG2]|nr:RsbR, positive regulator of sigma-B [Bacillus sp. OG2]
MSSIGRLPEHMQPLDALKSIGENIIIADKDYKVAWMNDNARKLLSQAPPLFGFAGSEDLIGLSMDCFHRNPGHQKQIMKRLKGSHRSRINIKDQFVTDIVISPVNDKNGQINGYIVMLMDVTTKSEEDRKKEVLIQALSVPMITIWDCTLALPLIGGYDKERSDYVLGRLLEKCVKDKIKYVLIDLSGLYDFQEETKFELQKLYDCLRLIGTECLLVGMTAELARTAGDIHPSIQSFRSAHEGLKYLIKRNFPSETELSSNFL